MTLLRVVEVYKRQIYLRWWFVLSCFKLAIFKMDWIVLSF